MPPITPRSSFRLPSVAGLLLVLCTLSAAAGAAFRPDSAEALPAGNGTGLAAVYVDAKGNSVSRVDPTVDFAWGYGSPAPGVSADNFSVRWTGELEPRYSETYSLSTVSDDGLRLWLDGRLLIDNWTEHSRRQAATAIRLVAGRRYALKIEYFEKAGVATAQFSWSSASQARQIVPRSQLYPGASAPPPPANDPPSVSLTSPADGSIFAAPATVPLAASASDGDGSVNRVEFLANGVLVAADTTAPYSSSWGNVGAGSYSLVARATDDDGAVKSSSPVAVRVTGQPPPVQDGSGTGLSGQYFDGPNFTGSSLSRIDSKVDFDWGLGAPAPSLAPDDFSVRWVGRLEPRFSETYSLSTVSDDGVRLWLDGQLLLDNWTTHAATEDAVSIALVAGRRYDIKLEFFEAAQHATARLLWSSPSQAKQPVPQSQLYPAATPPPPPPPVNQPPSVSLTSPTGGSSYTAPASVALAASASDSDGSVSRVEFFANGTLVGTDTAAPFAYTWPNVPAGSYSITARATDDDGAAAGSTAANITVTAPPGGSGTGLRGQYFDNEDFSGPSVSRVDSKVDFDWDLGAPAPSLSADTFSVRWTGQLEARFTETYTLSTVSDDGVRLWLDGQLVIDNWTLHGETENSITRPLVARRRYEVKLEFFDRGQHAIARLLWASASQPKQAVSASQLYPAAAPPANTPPTVSLTSPSGASTYTAPATVPVAASASDPDGSVTLVEFFANGTLVGSDSTAPYSLSWSNVAASTYSLTARATDNGGEATTSAPVSITVNTGSSPPPPPPGPVPPGGGSVLLPGVSLDAVFDGAACGAVFTLAAGTWPSQSISGSRSCSAPVTFREAAGARVVLGGLDIDADWVTVVGIETTLKGSAPGAGNQRGVWVGPGSSHVTLVDVDAGSVASWQADHLTVRGGDFGPCKAVTGDNVCSNNKQDLSTDVLIENAFFHDLEYDPSAPGAHWECMYLNGGRNVTIRGNRFERCAIFDLFATISGSEAGKMGHENLTIEGNYFDCATNGSGSPSRCWSSLSLSWCQNGGQPSYRNVLIKGNNFADGRAGIEYDFNAEGAGCVWPVRVEGNRLQWNGRCQPQWTYVTNVFYGGTGCGPTNTRGD